MVELLSPAGEINAFKSAIENGCDAIYMGCSKYNARAMAKNFSIDEYISCIKYAHLRGVKVYLTLNTLIYENEIKEAVEMLIDLYSHGLDAVILQDIGAATLIKKVLPNLELHASTQMSVHNLGQVKFLESLGFSRVVLAREMTTKEIKFIRDNCSLELEVFVHGALCVSYSGQCLMSSMIGDRSGNRGKCAGPCRMKYSFYEDGNKVIDGYLLSKKDIFGIDYVKELTEIGVDSLKIEGRGKTPEYVGLVTEKYRKAIDDIVDIKDKRELIQMFNRSGESLGYFKQVESINSISINSAKNTGIMLGNVLEVKNKMIKMLLLEDIDMHDGFEVYAGSNVICSNIVTCIKEEKGNIINKLCNKGETIWIGDVTNSVKPGCVVYKTSSNILNKKYLEKVNKVARKTLVPITVNILEGKDILVKVMNNDIAISAIPEKAIKKELDYESISMIFEKDGESPFKFEITDFNIDTGLFVPISKLNELRRKLISTLENSLDINIDVNENYKLLDKLIKKHDIEINNISVMDKESLNLDSTFIYKYNKENENKYLSDENKNIYINISDIMKDEDIIKRISNIKNVYVYIPNITLKNLENYIVNNLEKLFSRTSLRGILIGNYGYMDICKNIKERQGISLIADYSLNIASTYSAMFIKELGFDKVCVSRELDNESIENISRVINVEVLDNLCTAMTTRFCPIKAYLKNCNCTSKSTYILKDSFNTNYNIVCDNVDCTVKLVREIPTIKNIDKNFKNISFRKSYID